MTVLLWVMVGFFAQLYVVIGLAVAVRVYDNCRVEGKSIIVSIAITGLAIVGWPVLLVYVSKKAFR